MRVLLALLSGGFAGTERHAVELAGALTDHAEVGILLRARPFGAPRDAYEALRQAVPESARVFTAARGVPAPGALAAVARFRPHLVHAHHERSARVMSRWAGRTPVVATIHVHWRARDFAQCAGLICLTEAQASEVPASFPGPVRVIGNWVLPHPRPSAERLARLRAELDLPAGQFVIGSVGRLEPVKNVGGLLQAFAAPALADARLVIVGDGDERPALEALAGRLGVTERVRFTGFREDVRDLYWLFDVFALASHDEPFGLVMLEAASAGVPVVATDTTGAREIARRHPIRIVPVDDPTAMTAALCDMRGVTPPALVGFGVAESVAEVMAFYRTVLRQ